MANPPFDMWGWYPPPPNTLLDESYRPSVSTTLPPRTVGKGSVQRQLPPTIGQHDAIPRVLEGIGEGMVSGYQSLGRAPRNWDDALNQFFATMPGSGLLGTVGGRRIASPIRAYHGSPHQFDEFDISRIGSGEGAQAYGHGLYFAEAEPVAHAYRRNLSFPTRPVTGAPDVTPLPHIDGQLFEPGNFDIMRIAQSSRDPREIARRLRDYVSTNSSNPYAAAVDAQRIIDAIEQGRYSTGLPGHMYEVGLHARPEQFLDWDRPLSGQTPAIQSFMTDRFPSFLGRRTSLGMPEPDGHELSRIFSRKPNIDSAAEAGIPGIRYLDQGSRGAGTGTHNYVVFDPSIIEILRRYGIVGPLVGAGAAATLMGDRGASQ